MDAQELIDRNKIEDKYKWNLSLIYPNDNELESDFKWVYDNLKNYNKYQGKVANSDKSLLEVLNFNEQIERRATKIIYYVSALRDTDLNNGKYQSLYDRASKLLSEVSAANAFLYPELLKSPEEKIIGFIAKNKDLKIWEHYLKNIYRQKKHSLSEEQEKLMAMLSPIKEIPGDAYSVLNNAELPFPVIKDSDGKDIRLSHGRYRSALYSNDREYRKRVYKGTYEPYDALKATMAVLYNGRINTRIINSKIRNYTNPIEAALADDNIPNEVFYNLIKTAKDNIKVLHRWAKLKKEVLKLNELHPYDTYVSLIPNVEREYTFDEAKTICLEALKPLGKDYQDALNKAFNNRWIDVYETKGKRSGAYSNSCGCGVNPIILLNWNNTLDDVFTLIHELGHNMHSFYTDSKQPFHYHNYSTFVAEVASTTNEALLLDYMIKNTAKTKEEKMFLIEKFLVNAQTTFFRQTRFAEFEMLTHEKTMSGEVFNADDLTNLFANLYQDYWGPEMVVDKEEGLSWARVHHLVQYNFYVFQYSTGFAAAQALSQQIIEEGQPAVDRYINNFLLAGNSDYSIDILKKAGVDMSKPQPIQKTIDKFSKYLDDLEKLLKEK